MRWLKKRTSIGDAAESKFWGWSDGKRPCGAFKARAGGECTGSTVGATSDEVDEDSRTGSVRLLVCDYCADYTLGCSTTTVVCYFSFNPSLGKL